VPHRFNPEDRATLHSPERQQRLPIPVVLAALNLRPTDILIDIGAGTGYFAIPALEILGKKGRVIAVDISRKMLNGLKENLKGKKANLKLIVARAEKIPLPPACADRILMALVLHEVEDKAQALAEARRLIKKNGTLVIVEWTKTDPPPGPPISDRIAYPELLAFSQQAGLLPIAHSELNQFHYLVSFKPAPKIMRTTLQQVPDNIRRYSDESRVDNKEK
jgi:ubiquinone/menaquinone biosynthesis C-methylase UbiE